MSRASSRERVTLIALAAAPAVVIQLLRAFDTFTLPKASAAAQPETPQLVAAMPLAPTESSGQSQAAEWIREKSRVPIERDPFQDLLQPKTPTAEPVAVARPVEPKLPELKASGFLGRGAAAMVSINHRICRVGADLGEGWTLEAIDPVRRVITVVHTTGLRHEIESER